MTCPKCYAMMVDIGTIDDRDIFDPRPDDCIVYRSECPVCGHYEEYREYYEDMEDD